MKKIKKNSISEPNRQDNEELEQQLDSRPTSQDIPEILKVIIEEENFFGDQKQVYKVNQITLEELNYEKGTQQVQLTLLCQKLQSLGFDMANYQAFYQIKKSYFVFCGIAPQFLERYVSFWRENEVYFKIRQTYQQINKIKQQLAENEAYQEQTDEFTFGRKISKVRTILEQQFSTGLMIKSVRRNQKSADRQEKEKNKIAKKNKFKKIKIGQLIILISN